MNLEYAAIILIVIVAAVGMMSYIWESLTRIERMEWVDKMQALRNIYNAAANNRRIK